MGSSGGAPNGAPRSESAIADGCARAQYYLGLYGELTAASSGCPAFPRHPPAGRGHVGWFQEFWCALQAPRRRGGTPRSFARPMLGSFRLGSARTRWDLPLPDWEGIRAYLAARSTTR